MLLRAPIATKGERMQWLQRLRDQGMGHERVIDLVKDATGNLNKSVTRVIDPLKANAFKAEDVEDSLQGTPEAREALKLE